MEKYVVRRNDDHTEALRKALSLGLKIAKENNCEIMLVFSSFKHAKNIYLDEAISKNLANDLVKNRACMLDDVSIKLESAQTFTLSTLDFRGVVITHGLSLDRVQKISNETLWATSQIMVEWANGELDNWLVDNQAKLVIPS